MNVANGGTSDPSGQEHIRSFLKHGCAKAVFFMVSTKNQIVDRLWVDAIDHASIDKALTQTRAFIENQVRGVEQQERDKASKTKGPKLRHEGKELNRDSHFFRSLTHKARPPGRPLCFGNRIDRSGTIDATASPVAASGSLPLPPGITI
jgi:hypothetical protein